MASTILASRHFRIAKNTATGKASHHGDCKALTGIYGHSCCVSVREYFMIKKAYPVFLCFFTCTYSGHIRVEISQENVQGQSDTVRCPRFLGARSY